MLNAGELKEWIAQNGTGEKDRRYINGISYLFTVMNDGWIAIFEVDNGLYIPLIQARDIAHAESWCVMRERPNVPFNIF